MAVCRPVLFIFFVFKPDRAVNKPDRDVNIFVKQGDQALLTVFFVKAREHAQETTDPEGSPVQGSAAGKKLLAAFSGQRPDSKGAVGSEAFRWVQTFQGRCLFSAGRSGELHEDVDFKLFEKDGIQVVFPIRHVGAQQSVCVAPVKNFVVKKIGHEGSQVAEVIPLFFPDSAVVGQAGLF